MADERTTGTARVKRGLAEMLRGGVIMDVVDAQQAKIAEDAGAVAVMALERVPSDRRRNGGAARMSDPRDRRDVGSESVDERDVRERHHQRPLVDGGGAVVALFPERLGNQTAPRSRSTKPVPIGCCCPR